MLLLLFKIELNCLALLLVYETRVVVFWSALPDRYVKRIRGGGQSKKFSGNPKVSLQHHCNAKISANFILKNLYMNIKYPETMQTKVKIFFFI